MSFNLVSIVNNQCPNCSHAHRRATDDEYHNNKLYRLKYSGCYLCNELITFDKMTPPIIWQCNNPSPENRFLNITYHKIKLDVKLAFIYVTQIAKPQFYLPLELILLIFKNLTWVEKSHLIKKITPKLIAHTSKCRTCAEKLVVINSTFTCHHHIIPRKSNYNLELLNYF